MSSKHLKNSRNHQEQLPSKESVFGAEKTREQVMEEVKAEPEIFREFQKLSPRLQEEFLQFVMGVRGLKVTYDPVFKKVFNPEVHPERLEDFLSLCLKRKVKILRVLPNESERLTEEGSLLIMDMLVQLVTRSLVNVEIQRMGYLFPGARCACYSSDLLMRQYSQVREEKRKTFSYQDIKEVYTIVLIQKSTEEFGKFPEKYVHHFRQTSDTGLEINMLQEYLMIPLDIFMESLQNRNEKREESGKEPKGKLENKLEAWLTFIASDRPEDIMEVIRRYPEFEELYREVFEFRYQKKELISMYSEALSILDANTVKYMVEQQKREIEKQKREMKRREEELQRQEEELQKQEEELQKQEKEIQKQDEEIQNLTKTLEEERREVERLRKLLKEREEM